MVGHSWKQIQAEQDGGLNYSETLYSISTSAAGGSWLWNGGVGVGQIELVKCL